MRGALVALALTAMPVAQAAGPEDWAGMWRGSCRITPAQDGIESFRMSLTIGPGSAEDRLRWRIEYETGKRDVRDYELLKTETPGRYALDEKNGLILDSAFADGVLYATFSIGEVLVTGTYSVGEDGAMTANMPSFDVVPSRTTCLTGAPETCAGSFALVGAQHCRLTRQEMRKLP